MFKKNLNFIAPIESVDSIISNGIVGNEKLLFEDSTIPNAEHFFKTCQSVPMTVRDLVATKLGLTDKYAIFKVDISSIKELLIQGYYYEMAANFQYITYADITADMVKLIGVVPNQLAKKCYEPFKNLPIQSYKKSEIQILNQE